MEYECSYDTGSKPFTHDKNRGKWSSPKDFLFVCIGHAFKADAFFIMPVFIFQELRIYALIPYFITLGICVVPIMFMQSFLGQFSGTGFISVFRIAPIYKGIGYVSLVVNWVALTYYSIFSAIPLFYFIHSLRPTIPWSCDGIKDLMQMPEDTRTPCNTNFSDELRKMVVPSVEFFRVHLNYSNHTNVEKEGTTFSWELMLCTLIIWAIVTAVLNKSTEEIGRFIRYSFTIVVALMCTCLLRFMFLPGALSILYDFFIIPYKQLNSDFFHIVPIMALSSLGPGWGSILTMASYNNFKTNIYWYSWVTCLAQLGVMLGLAFLSMFMRGFMESLGPDVTTYVEFHDSQWSEFLVIPSGLTLLEMPHFWSLIFLGMLVLGSLNLLVVQLFSVLSSLFDEFEDLRQIKQKVTYIIAGVLAFASMFFCSNFGIQFFEILAKYSMASQMVLNLLLLLVVLWIYGRERFQRDLNFMTSREYSTWMVNIVRFVTPLFLIFGLFVGLLLTESTSFPKTLTMYLIASFIFLLPCCVIPGYCCLKVKQTTGIIGRRWKKCCTPTDWYPADPVYKQRYEESFSRTDLSHPLTVVADME